MKYVDSREYWINRYKSFLGAGVNFDPPKDKVFQYKIDVVNQVLTDYNINSVIEFGCGLGWIADSVEMEYSGVDVSPEAIYMCKRDLGNRKNLRFGLYPDALKKMDPKEATMSLDVIYHLLEDKVYEEYMNNLFGYATKLVIVHSSNTTEQYEGGAKHVMHRKFSDYVNDNLTDWKLDKIIPTKFPYYKGIKNLKDCAFADTHCYVKK
jgi:hypothetical protein